MRTERGRAGIGRVEGRAAGTPRPTFVGVATLSAVTAVVLLLATVATARPGPPAIAEPASQRTVEQTLATTPDGVVEVDNPAGSVRVVGWDRSEVRVSGTLGAGSEGIEIDGGEGRVEIRVLLPERAREVDGSDLEIRVPRGSRLEVSTLSAELEARDVDGGVSAESVSGDVSLRTGATSVSAKSLSGDVEIVLAGGERGRTVRASSASGRVRIVGASGRVEASTVSGGLVVEEAVLEGARLESVSGRIRLAAAIAPGARVELENFSGDVELALPGDLSARYELDTFSGDIANEFGPPPRRSSRDGPGMKLAFSSGSEGDASAARVVATTFSGSIRLRRR